MEKTLTPHRGSRQRIFRAAAAAGDNYPCLDGFREAAYVPRMDRITHTDFGRKFGLELALRGALLCA